MTARWNGRPGVAALAQARCWQWQTLAVDARRGELQRCVGHGVAASGNDKREGLGSATATKGVGRSTTTTTARGERRSLEWERSTEKATMDPPEAGEVRSGTARAARSWGEEARATAQKKEGRVVAGR